MQCEICNAIKRLGLDPSAHDLWFCLESHHEDLIPPSRKNRLLLKAAMLQRSLNELILQATRYLAGTGNRRLPACRRRYIRLGL